MKMWPSFIVTCKLHLLAGLLLLAAPLSSLAGPPSEAPVEELRQAVLERNYGQLWDVLTDDSRRGRNREEFIRHQEGMMAEVLGILERRHGVPFSTRVLDFCAWSGIDREHFQGRYRVEFSSRVPLPGKSWKYITTCHFKLSVVGEKVSLTYTRFTNWLNLVAPRIIL